MSKVIGKVILITLAIGVLTTARTTASFTASFQTGKLSAQERRGHQIYVKGISPSGKDITAVIGGTEVEAPASAFPCASCHGRDGLGRTEGGVSPSDVTWNSLTRPYLVTGQGGRKHPAYDESFLKRAITMGMDPAGNRLRTAMPKFRMSLEDMADLVSYLKVLGRISDPGITESTITVGTIIPAEGPLADAGQSVKAVLQAYFDELNSDGGIFGRKLELQTISGSREPDVRGKIVNGNLFALISPFTTGADQELTTLFENEELPVIGPITLLPQTRFPINRQIFYLCSGLPEQIAALFNFGSQNLKASFTQVAVVSAKQGATLTLPLVIREKCKESSLKLVADIEYADGQFNAGKLAAQLREANPGTVFVFGSAEEQRELLNELAKVNFIPNVMLPGPLVGQEIFDIPVDFKNKIFVSYPTLPLDRSPAAINRYVAFAKKHSISPTYLNTQISAYCAAEILVHTLKLAGRDLNQEKTVLALEGLRGFETGLIPPITYGPNRRIGALGAYVVSLDLEKKQLVASSVWIPAN